MKTNLLFLGIIMLLTITTYGQVAINTDGSKADTSAMLDVKSTNKGFLPPRMTEAQMNAIPSPAEGLIVYCTDCDPKGPYYFNGNCFESFSFSIELSADEVYNCKTGKVWMDRNLGASQVATSSTDYLAYGSLYQWGRGSDGHQVINWTSSTTSDGAEQNNETTTLSSTDNPGHGNFIVAPNSPYDWRNPKNDNLWQGLNGTNNPCPSGYRLPTEAEWQAELNSWSSNNAAGAFASPLKLPVAGFRFDSNGSLHYMGSYGYCWSSTVDGIYSRFLLISSSKEAFMTSFNRACGLSVRCIKD